MKHSMIGKLIVFGAISAGGALGWQLGTPGGLIGSYFVSVLGSSIGLYVGRRLQKTLGTGD